MKTAVSIVVPVYNVAPYLRKCLDSIRAQTLQEWECICVDDGSSDGSAAVLDAYAAEDERFRVVHQANAGVAQARQNGLDAARGEFVGWVDPDDWVEPDHFGRLYRVACESGADLAWCDVVEERPSGNVCVDQTCADDSETLFNRILMHRFRGSLWDKVFRRSALSQAGARFPSRKQCEIMEDNYFLATFLISRPKVRHVSGATYHYVMREGSLSNKGQSAAWWQQVIDANNAIFQLLNGRADASALRYRMSLFKCWLFWERVVTDDMFYGFQPQIRWLSRGVAATHYRVAIWFSCFGLRAPVLAAIDWARRICGKAPARL